jgi:sulfotransferase
MAKIFFNSSMPRAGSTMISNLIGQNPDFYVTPTSGVLELVYGARENYTHSPEFKAQDEELMKKGFLSFCRNGLNGFFEPLTDKPYILDKSRGWFNYFAWLDMVFPEPKIICMVRDLRDIVASMEKNLRKNPDKSNPIINEANRSGTTVEKRVDIWVNQPPIGVALERVKDLILKGYDNKILFIRYEDLCLRPEYEMNRIYEYLGVASYKHDFDNIEQITVEDDTVYGVFGDHTIRTKLEMKPSDAKKVLGADVCDWIFNTYRWYFDKFNYKR